MPVQECQRDGKRGYQYGDSGHCYTYTTGNDAERREAKRLAYIQGAAITASTGEELKGLYLVAPQGRLIYDGIKSAIARSRLDDAILGECIIVSKEDGAGLAFGTALIDEPYQVSSKAFKDYYRLHRVDENDRLRWWQNTDPLFIYPVKSFDAFDEPIEVEVPPGTQMIMDSVQFKAQSFSPPKAVQEAAARGLELRREFNRGGTEVGVARARDLSNGKNISLDTIGRMVSYFARHEVDKDAPDFDNWDNPSAGRVSWELWGGDAGKNWANGIWNKHGGKEMDTKATFPLASRDRSWSSDAAVSRLRRYADAEDGPNAQYRRYFMWYDPDRSDLFTGAHLPYVDIVSGEPKAIPKAIFNIAAILQGARGGVDLPESVRDTVKRKVESYYAAMREKFDDDSIRVPWGEKVARGECVCPECGATIEHEAGIPCVEIECPECGAQMTRATDAQAATQLDQQIKEGGDTTETVGEKSDETIAEGEKVTDDETDIDTVEVAEPETIVETEMKEAPVQVPSPSEFTLLQRNWSDEKSTVAYDILVKSPSHGTSRYMLQRSPVNAATLVAFPGENGNITDTSDATHDPFTLPETTVLDIKQKTLYNPTESAARLKVVERGPMTVITHHDNDREYEFDGKSVKGTWTMQMNDSGQWDMERTKSLWDKVIGTLNDIKALLIGDEKVPVKVEIGPDHIVPESTLPDFSTKDFTNGAAFAFKAKDGKYWWMQWTTNAFKDRENEIFTTKAIEDYVDRHSNDATKGQFWFWHIPGSKFADVKWQAVVGRFLVQAGPFDDTKIGTAFKNFFIAHPDGHETVAPHGWGTSHGYYFTEQDREDGVYEQFEIKESTVLPWSRAANQFAPTPKIFQEVKQMNDEQRKALETIGGNALATAVETEGTKLTKDLEESVEFKEIEETKTEETPTEETVVEESKEETVVESLTKEDFLQGLKVLADTLRSEFTSAIGELSSTFDEKLATVSVAHAEEVKQVEETISETPAASLTDAIKSVIGSRLTQVSDKEAKEMGEPTENTDKPQAGGMFWEQLNWTH